MSGWPKQVRVRLRARPGQRGAPGSHLPAGAPPGPQDDALLEALRSHDPSALESLAQMYGTLLFNVAARITGSSADADDIVQEALLRAWRRPPSSGPAHLRAWLVTVTTRLALNELRRRRRHPVAPVPGADRGQRGTGGPPPTGDEGRPSYDPYKAVAAHLSEAEALRALVALPPTLRAAMVLRALYGLDYAEIARALGCSVGAARVKVHRARQQCARALLGPEPPEEPACAEVRELIAPWADGELAPEDAAKVEAHVSSCRYCQQTRERAETARSAWGLLPLLAWGGSRRTVELAAATASPLARARHSARVRRALMGERDRHVIMALAAIATAGAAVGATVASVGHRTPVASVAPGGPAHRGPSRAPSRPSPSPAARVATTAPRAPATSASTGASGTSPHRRSLGPTSAPARGPAPATTPAPAPVATSAPTAGPAPPRLAAGPPARLWPYTATAVSSQVPGLVPGQAYGLIHLANNITMEDISSVVGSVVLHVNVKASPYSCLDGQAINVFSFEGAYFVHDGLQGAMCTYGTWELAPASLAAASQAPAIASATAGPGPSLVLSGQRFGPAHGRVTLVGYSPSASGPVYQARVKSWAPARVRVSLPATLPQGQPYDVVLFSASGAVATALVK